MKTADNTGKFCLVGDEFCINHKLEVNPGIGLMFYCAKDKVLEVNFESFFPFTEGEKQRAMKVLRRTKCVKETK